MKLSLDLMWKSKNVLKKALEHTKRKVNFTEIYIKIKSYTAKIYLKQNRIKDSREEVNKAITSLK